MQRKGRKASSKVGIAGLVAVAFLAAPGASNAAAGPAITCMQAYGHEIPAKVCEPNPDLNTWVDNAGKVFPNSKAHFVGTELVGPTGNFFIEGFTAAGAKVTLSVTDGISTLGPFEIAANNTTGAFLAEINATSLGQHKATPTGNTGDNRLGPTTLTVTAAASNISGTGPSKTDTIVKHAATNGDSSAPVFSNLQWPPQDVDHGCFHRYTARQWNDTNDGYQIPGLRFTGYSQCPYFPIAGTLTDLTDGLSSEISDVRITIEKQRLGQTFIDVRDSIDSEFLPAGRARILTRITGDVSRYWYLLNIKDLPPNAGAWAGLDDWYTITVTACDAWGDVGDPTASANNCSSTSLGEIAIYPY